jgi:8-oxo-dGTP pyrophosphatase MutT (NUDIX family)
MYVTRETIKIIEELYGRPDERTVRFEMDAREFDGLKNSQKNGRSHDVTMFIRKDGKFIVIAKHFYPPGLYRAPSGGINPSEDFISGLKREAREETGCEIDPKSYIMRVNVDFFCNSETVNWVSHVFVADYLSGELAPRDTKEIREVTVAAPEDFKRFREIMLASSIGGLHYRAYLHDEVLEKIDFEDLY